MKSELMNPKNIAIGSVAVVVLGVIIFSVYWFYAREEILVRQCTEVHRELRSNCEPTNKLKGSLPYSAPICGGEPVFEIDKTNYSCHKYRVGDFIPNDIECSDFSSIPRRNFVDACLEGNYIR